MVLGLTDFLELAALHRPEHCDAQIFLNDFCANEFIVVVSKHKHSDLEIENFALRFFKFPVEQFQKKTL